MRFRAIATYIFVITLVLVLPSISPGKLLKTNKSNPCETIKFSGEGEDFPIACAMYLCPFDAACAGSGIYEKLTVLRQVREKILKNTKKGRKYVSYLGQYGAELARITLQNPDIAEDMRTLSKILIPIAKDMLDPENSADSILMDGDQAVKIKIISMKFEEKTESEELRRLIIRLRFDLDEYTDKTAAEVFNILDADIQETLIDKTKQIIPKLTPEG